MALVQALGNVASSADWSQCAECGGARRRYGCPRRSVGRRRRWRVAVASANTDWSNAVVGELPERELSSMNDFARLLVKGDDAELQCAVVSYYFRRRFPWSLFKPNVQVDLVAAIHVGDAEYYSAVQRELNGYDRVLYEMVARKWKKAPSPKYFKKRRFTSFVGASQTLLSRLLGLDLQLESIDYQGSNWQHADLDIDTFRALQREKKESLFNLAAQMAGLVSAQLRADAVTRNDLAPWKGGLLWAARTIPMPLLGLLTILGICAPEDAPLSDRPEVKALLNLDIGGALKVFIARQICARYTDGAASVLKNSVIIGKRNQVALQELEKAVEEGCKRIAIFYGGGHLPDMDSNLRRMGYYPERIKWQTAWSIRSREAETSDEQITTGWPLNLNRYQVVAIAILSLILSADLLFWELFLKALVPNL